MDVDDSSRKFERGVDWRDPAKGDGAFVTGMQEERTRRELCPDFKLLVGAIDKDGGLAADTP
jgi:hypothetical protein